MHRPLLLSLALLWLALLWLAPTAWAQNLFIQGNALSDRFYNSDTGPTNSQLTLDFPITQAGILQNILTWGENDGQGGLNGVGESFQAFVLRPLNSTNYQVVFATGYLTVTNVGTNTFAISGTPFGLQVGDVIAHYGRGIPLSINTGGPSSVYVAVNLPPPILNTTITVPSSSYPLYDDGGRDYAIQVQLLGQPFLVTTNSDNGSGSLRQAVLDANAFANASTINFATNLSGQTITLTSGEMVLSNSITIDASALTNGLTISGNNSSGIFLVNNGPTVSLLDLTLTGAINSAIGNSGNLNLMRCTLFGNGNAFQGGAIANFSGVLTLTNCTLSGNSAIYGGAIVNANSFAGGSVTLTYCTLSDNSSGGGGGAIDNYNLAALTLTGCIIAGNTDSSETAPDLWMETGLLTANHCLIGDGMNSTLVNGANGNQVGASGSPINALLAPPGNYGGSSQTMPPLAGSPAIDAGVVIAGLTSDQRGYARLSGAQVDIGAVEVNPNTIVTTSSDDGNAGSLRNVVANTTNTDLISFAPNLSGQTILLTSGQIGLNASVTIDASTLPGGIILNGNHASRIFSVNGGTVVLNSLTITNGTDAGNGGGGGIVNYAALTLNNCTLAGNTASDPNWGGGGILSYHAMLTLNSCTLAGNSTDAGGGGIFIIGGTAVVNQSTLAGNSADTPSYSGGGGIANSGGVLMVTNSIVAANTVVGGDGADIFNNFFGTLTFGGADLVQTVPTNFDNEGTINGTYITAAPQLAPLGNYGGPTQTMPPLPRSPAIDAGLDSVTNFLVTDQRGFPRLVGAHVDIGAVESGNAIPGFVPVVTTNSDAIYSIGAGAVSLREAVAFATGNSLITFGANLSGQTITLTNGELVLDKNLLIDGSALANGIQISGNHTSRIFNISTNGGLTLTSLTMINANGGGDDGGALYNAGNFSVLNYCTFTGNSTGSGGAIKNAGGTLVLNECTLAGNSTTGGGGAIVNYASLFLNGCTLTANSSSGFFGGAVYSETGSHVALDNTIAAGNAGFDIYNNGTLTLTKSNIVQSISGTSIGTTPINASPQLAALGNYGGPTLTMPPLPGSPAIDAGADSEITFLPKDQRNYPRLAGAHVDIGAVEGIYSAAGPGTIKSITHLGNGSVQLSFTNVTDAVFTVLTSTNVSLPLNNWTQIGFATESPVGSSQFPFTDTQATNYPQRYYRIGSP